MANSLGWLVGTISVVSGCLVPGPGVMKAEGHCPWVCRAKGRGRALPWLVCSSKMSYAGPFLPLRMTVSPEPEIFLRMVKHHNTHTIIYI